MSTFPRFNCSICLDWLDDVRPVKITKCGHVFHEECIERSPQCPCCREEVNELHSVFFSSSPFNQTDQQGELDRAYKTIDALQKELEMLKKDLAEGQFERIFHDEDLPNTEDGYEVDDFEEAEDFGEMDEDTIREDPEERLPLMSSDYGFHWERVSHDSLEFSTTFEQADSDDFWGPFDGQEENVTSVTVRRTRSRWLGHLNSENDFSDSD
ncbi:hypothetical protein QR680_003648 [Steinernema hermaphroditum]|uniref:RING-type domain-containing protein n=1 Tax=Steinernema hermaphroditum TaxID=289476 RepID=A0AA39HNC9_9BILA|nr:hypothetical protein QR680_003648 [Steinernema hermaphroditum]